MPDLISVVITTYNRSDALRLVLEALEQQTDSHFEIVIADDGSSMEHQLPIAQWGLKSRLRLTHVWHPDVGFTASQVRNLGVSRAQGEYIIFLDGDCVPELDFVAQHRKLRQAGTFVNGSRVLLSEPFTRQVICGSQRLEGQPAGTWLQRFVAKSANKPAPRLRLPDSRIRRQKRVVWKGIRSCNMGVWKSDYLAVNGFDETFVGWGHEDADFVLRLHNAGLVRKNGGCATEVYHLWHTGSPRHNESVNASRVLQRRDTGIVKASVGYEESLNAANVVVRSWG